MENWMGEIIAELHMKKIKQKDLANKMGVTNEYVCTILNGKREKVPANMEQRMREAIKQICGMEEKEY